MTKPAYVPVDSGRVVIVDAAYVPADLLDDLLTGGATPWAVVADVPNGLHEVLTEGEGSIVVEVTS